MATNTTNYDLIKPAVNDPADQDLWGGYLNENMDTIDTELKTLADAVAAIPTGVPSGAFTWYCGSSAPTGWLECDGSAVSRTTYSDLFTAIGTTFGSGDGSTTFNIPDLHTNNRFIRAADGSTINVGSTQTDAFPSHTHTITKGVDFGVANHGHSGSSAATRTDNGGSITTGSAGSGSESRPHNIALMPIIKT